MSNNAAPFGDPAALRMRLHEAIDRNSKRWKVAAVVLAVAVVAGGWMAGQVASDPPIAASVDALPKATADSLPSANKESGVIASASPDSPNDSVVVQVAGAVVNPGVFDLDGTDRVNDAITEAGGFAADADPNRVNLAAKVADGQQIFVPRIGEPAPVASGTSAAASSAGSADSSGVVNVNTASVVQLEELPGIGPSLAKAIVAHRDKNGPFKSVQELNDVKGIGDAKFSELEDKVAV